MKPTVLILALAMSSALVAAQTEKLDYLAPGGEEQGLLGSRAYVREHVVDPETMQLKGEHARLTAYFNSDNGTGRVRGIWVQSNMAVRSIFEQWIGPLRDLGVTVLGPRPVSQTDHVSFDNVGIPAFQFLVDRLEYNSRTHPSNMDVFDRVQRDDMVQQATVIAVFAYDAAMRDRSFRASRCRRRNDAAQYQPNQDVNAERLAHTRRPTIRGAAPLVSNLFEKK